MARTGTIYYIGGKTASIANIPYFYVGQCYKVYNDAAEKDLKAFDNFLKTNEKLKNYKYLYVVTADMFQKQNHEILEQNNFKKIITFESSHGGGENLSLWVKTQKDFDSKTDFSEEKIGVPTNCSVRPFRAEHYVCQIVTKTKKDTIKSLKEEGFERADKTEMFYKIKKDYLLAEKI